MAPPSRPWTLAGLLVATWLCMACNPLMLPYFLCVGPDPQNKPEFQLATEDFDPKKPIKVLVLTSTPLETRPELLGADRELAALFSQKLQEQFKQHGDNIILSSTNKVQKFKDEHPNWQALSLAELGKRLDADYVIDLEIGRMSLYQPGSGNTLFLGHADISITVANVHKDEDGPVFRKEYASDYQRSGSRAVSDISVQKFRRDFLTRMATDLTWVFTAHPSSEEQKCE